MLDPHSVADLVRRVRLDADGAAMKSRELSLMLLELTPTPFSRDQFIPGHITCSGLVVHPDGGRLLLVHHRRLDRWLLPGGHVEPGDATIGDAARREVVEETAASLTAAPAPLAGIDVHGIPGKGDEPYHLHHDLIFALRALSGDIRVSPESRAVAWCTEAEFDRYQVPTSARLAWARLR